MIEVRHPQIKILRSGNNVVYCRLLCVPVLFFWEAKQRNIVVGKSVCAAYSCANLPTLRLALSHDAVAVPLVTRGASSGAITDYAPTSSLSKYSLFGSTTLIVASVRSSEHKINGGERPLRLSDLDQQQWRPEARTKRKVAIFFHSQDQSRHGRWKKLL